jgi:NADP-dependent 3-hydroxy acid dehydrogenase YdfG
MSTIVISGASKGIGRAIAIAFAKKGHNIIACARNENNLIALKNELLAINPSIACHYFVADLSQKNQVKSFVSFILSNTNAIDVLVNNAGVFLLGNIYDEDDENLETMINTNLYSAYYLTKGLLPSMMSNKKGHIFNISSIAGANAYKNGSSYSISKFAMQGLTKSLRNEMKDFGIRVTGVLPGATLTDSWAGVDLPEERFIDPNDVAQTIVDIYNLSDRTVVEEIVLRPQLGDI